MKMLIVVFRRSLDEDVQQLLNSLDVKAFTEAPRVFGMGEAGHAFDSFEWPGFNSMILAAMDDEQADLVVERFKVFRDQLSDRQKGSKVPLRVLVLPCEQVV